MAERTQKQKPSQGRSTEQSEHAGVAEAVEQASVAAVASGDKLKAELDDLLDEIDEVLESNAEDFVKSYVQKGGE